MEVLLSGLIGYLFGNVNTAYIMGKKHGFDIRSRGSHNAGASNVVIVLGKKAGAITAIADIAKAYFAAVLAAIMFPHYRAAKEMAAVSCILGHIFPFTMKFKGGKGLACIAGGVLAYDVKVFLILLLIEAVLALVTDYICVMPITASVIIPILYVLHGGNILVLNLMVITAGVIIYKHPENIKRIFKGREARISFLWNREGEIERLRESAEE
jgi:glycerol-3-phosphate acyltransferase PlsY